MFPSEGPLISRGDLLNVDQLFDDVFERLGLLAAGVTSAVTAPLAAAYAAGGCLDCF